MAEEKRDMPRTQTSAPVKPPRTTTEPPQPDLDEGEAPSRRHHVSDESDAGGDQMPKGFDEPGAGI
jgi:hypothetical protein